MTSVNPIRVCFRFDDPKATSDHDLEARVLDMFWRFGFPLTVAVVPFSQAGADFVALRRGDVPHLSEAHVEGRIEVALHGYRHKAIARDARGVPSEFCGVERQRQLGMMGEGKAVLEDTFGVPMKGFVPPWNTHDANSLDVAAELGFSYLSCGVQRGARIRNPLVIPKTCALQLGNARTALDSAKRHRRCQPVLVVVFHPDNFIEFRSPPGPGEAPANLSIPKLEQILEEFARCSDWMTVLTLTDLANELQHDSVLWTSSEFDFVTRASWGLRKRCPTGFLSTRPKLGGVPGVMGS